MEEAKELEVKFYNTKTNTSLQASEGFATRLVIWIVFARQCTLQSIHRHITTNQIKKPHSHKKK